MNNFQKTFNRMSREVSVRIETREIFIKAIESVSILFAFLCIVTPYAGISNELVVNVAALLLAIIYGLCAFDFRHFILSKIEKQKSKKVTLVD